MEKNNIQKNKRNRKRHAELERMALYAVGVILLGLVIGLAVKNYRLKSKLDNRNEKDSVVTGTSTDSDNTNGDASAATTEKAAELKSGTVECTDIAVPETEQEENYNGEDLADNGCPYAIKINRQENIVTIYKLDAAGYYTVPVKAMRCSVSPGGRNSSRTVQHTAKVGLACTV